MRDETVVSPQVEAALAAAPIPRSRLGAARCVRLDASERALSFWILGRFASVHRPRRSELEAAAQQIGTDVRSALAALAREDLVHVDELGEIAVAYPFRAGRGRPHRPWSSSARSAT